MFDWMHDIEGVTVLHTEFVVVTGDGAEHPLYERVAPLLRRIRSALGLDLVFVTQLASGRPCVRAAASCEQGRSIAPEHADPLEADFARALVAARGAAGALLALPVASKAGHDYGTLCGVAADAVAADALHAVARLVALSLSARNQAGAPDIWASSAAAPLGLDAQT